MSYIKYDLDITPAVYQQMEELRKAFLHEFMTKDQALDLIEEMGLPKDSPKVWELLFKYEVLKKKGKARNTKYFVSNEQYSYNTLQRLENEFYNGVKSKKEEPRDKVLGRTKLDPQYCMNYLNDSNDPSIVDFCINQLKKRGNYLIFEVTPKIYELKAISLEYLVQCSEAEQK